MNNTERDVIRRALAQGIATGDIARQLGIPPSRVAAVKAHMTMGTYGGSAAPAPPSDREAILSLLRQRLPTDEIARRIGVGRSRVAAIKAHMTMGSYGDPPAISTTRVVPTAQDPLVHFAPQRTPRLHHLFLNYRREDSAGWAGRLSDYLIAELGAGSVFMDIDRIPPGEDFPTAIDNALDECACMLVVIGPRWLGVVDQHGRQRLLDSQDFVRTEVERALNRNMRVLPVLVGGARMPGSSDLPVELTALARRQAFELSDRKWSTDFAELVAHLR